MTRTVFTSILLALMLFSTSNAAMPDGICPSVNGWWRIAADITPPDAVNALDGAEIKRLIGKMAFISDTYMTFGPYKCHVTSNKNGLISEQELRDTDQNTAYPYSLHPICKEAKLDEDGVPGVSVGKSCDVITAFDEGVVFELRRIHRHQHVSSKRKTTR